MLSRLTRTRRTTAGRLLALAYLFCVLAPAMLLAFGDAARAAPCITENEHGMGIVHEHAGAVAQHVRPDERSRDHSSLAVASAPDDGQAAAAAADPDTLPLDHHKSCGLCCGLACVSALPATVTEVVRPTAPQSVCLSDDYQAVADNAPPQLYRPPIA
jgi:hypothetical protein